MTKDQSYQGYSNHSTWAVALWVDNDAGLYEERKRVVHNSTPIGCPESRKRGPVADALKDWIENMMPDLGATLWADLLTAAIGDVDWLELAQMWIDEEE